MGEVPSRFPPAAEQVAQKTSVLLRFSLTALFANFIELLCTLLLAQLARRNFRYSLPYFLQRPVRVMGIPFDPGYLHPLLQPHAPLFQLSRSIAGLQSVRMVGRSDDDTVLFLPTYERILYPRVGQDLIHIGALARVEFQHTADDMSRLTGQ